MEFVEGMDLQRVIRSGELGERLGLSEVAVQQEVKRLRKRFRGELEREIEGTVERPEDVAGELRCLIMALG